MQRIFSNIEETAFLDKGIFSDEKLLDRCVLDVENQLEERPEIVVYGKVCRQQRNVGFFSNFSEGYTYSRRIMRSKQLTESLEMLLDKVNLLLGSRFNGILVNKYGDGDDCIGAHSDDESGLDNIGIVSISYGAERIFRIRDKKEKTILHDIQTTHCCILHMGGEFQKLYTHEIPKQKRIKQSRISFTFRKHNK